MYKKFYVHEVAVVNLSKIYFPKNAKKTCKPNNHDLNRDWISLLITFENVISNWDEPIIIYLLNSAVLLFYKSESNKTSEKSICLIKVKEKFGKWNCFSF